MKGFLMGWVKIIRKKSHLVSHRHLPQSDKRHQHFELDIALHKCCAKSNSPCRVSC